MSAREKTTQAKRPAQRSSSSSKQTASKPTRSSSSGSSSTSSGRSTKTPRTTSAAQSELATVTTELMTQMARSAAGELVKGNQPMNEVAKKVVGEAVETLDKRGPKLADEAGIMNWRYALLGWATWTIGKRVIKRKAKTAISNTTKGGSGNGAGRKQLEARSDG
jgi:hypothetical protein